MMIDQTLETMFTVSANMIQFAANMMILLCGTLGIGLVAYNFIERKHKDDET